MAALSLQLEFLRRCPSSTLHHRVQQSSKQFLTVWLNVERGAVRVTAVSRETLDTCAHDVVPAHLGQPLSIRRGHDQLVCCQQYVKSSLAALHLQHPESDPLHIQELREKWVLKLSTQASHGTLTPVSACAAVASHLRLPHFCTGCSGAFVRGNPQ